MPGRRQRITYTRRMQERLKKPYSDCDSTIHPMLQVAMDQFGGINYKYEQYMCAIICIQAYVLVYLFVTIDNMKNMFYCFSFKKCGCVDPAEWSTRYIFRIDENAAIVAPLCNEDSTCYREELTRINTDYNVWIENCPMCNIECQTFDFVTRMSALLAPTPWLYEEIKNKVENFQVPLSQNWSTTWKNDISSSYVALEIVSENSRLELFNDTPITLPVDLLSNIGGHTGLWIGISFLSLMEIIELASRLMLYLMKKLGGLFFCLA